MCGIVGLFLKDARLEPELGRLTAAMLSELRDRGPDSAGFAVYGGEVAGITKICAVAGEGAVVWEKVAKQLAKATGAGVTVEEIEDHAIFKTKGDGSHGAQMADRQRARGDRAEPGTVDRDLQGRRRSQSHRDAPEAGSAQGLARHRPHAHGDRIRPSPSPARIPSRPARTPASCTTARCRTTTACASSWRATASASRPRTTARWRPAYLTWRTREGDSLEQALERALDDLDGFYTFVVGTRDGFAVLRDPIACKPAVMAETDDWVAFGTEFRALATLPGIDGARIWEPEPATVYVWSRSS